MPPLAVPVVAQLRVLGRKWEELHPFTDPGTLDRATRLGAAFWLAHHLTELSPSAPLAGICSTCGQGTFSWCEGCYRRIGEESGRFFSAVCLGTISQLLMGLREGAGHLNMLRPSHYVAQRSLVMAESGMTTGKEISNRLWLRPLRKLPAFCHPFFDPQTKIIGCCVN